MATAINQQLIKLKSTNYGAILKALGDGLMNDIVRQGDQNSFQLLAKMMRCHMLGQDSRTVLMPNATSKFMIEATRLAGPARYGSGLIDDVLSICHSKDALIGKNESLITAKEHYYKAYEINEASKTSLCYLITSYASRDRVHESLELMHQFGVNNDRLLDLHQEKGHRSHLWKSLLSQIIKTSESHAISPVILRGIVSDLRTSNEGIGWSECAVLINELAIYRKPEHLEDLLSLVDNHSEFPKNIVRLYDTINKLLKDDITLERRSKVTFGLIKAASVDTLNRSITEEIKAHLLSTYLSIVTKSNLSADLKLNYGSNALRDFLEIQKDPIDFVSASCITNLLNMTQRYDMVFYIWHQWSKGQPYEMKTKELLKTKCNPTKYRVDEYHFMIPVVIDAFHHYRLNMKGRLNANAFLTVCVDAMGFYGKGDFVELLYKKIKRPSADFPHLELNVFNSFIEALTRCGKFEAAWQVLNDADFYGKQKGLWRNIDPKTVGSFIGLLKTRTTSHNFQHWLNKSSNRWSHLHSFFQQYPLD